MFYDVLQREDIETSLKYQAHTELYLAEASVDGSSLSSPLALETGAAPSRTRRFTYGKRALKTMMHRAVDRSDCASFLEHDQAPFQRSLSSHVTITASVTSPHRLLDRVALSVPSVDTVITTIREVCLNSIHTDAVLNQSGCSRRTGSPPLSNLVYILQNPITPGS